MDFRATVRRITHDRAAGGSRLHGWHPIALPASRNRCLRSTLSSHRSPVSRPGPAPASVSDSTDAPLPILLEEVEDARPPMVYFTVDQEVILRQDHSDIVVNADKHIVETLFHARRPSRHLLGKVAQLRMRYLVIT